MSYNKLQVEYKLLKSWDGGFKAEIQIKNLADTSLSDWNLQFDFQPQIEEIWRAEIVSQDGDTYSITGNAYTDSLAPGEAIAIRFKASGDSRQEPVFHLSEPAIDDGSTTGQDAEAAPPEDLVEEPATEPASQPQQDQTATVLVVPAGSSASELQAIIDGAPAGAVVRLAEGTFTFDRTITIARDDITLEGAGSQLTRIVTDFPAGTEGPAFAVLGNGLSGSFGLAADVEEGATAIELTGDHGFAAGDFLWIERPNSAEFFAEIGDTSWLEDKPLRTSIARVTAVDGNRLTLENGVHFDFGAADATVRKLDMAEDVTLRGFTIESTLGESDPANFANTIDAYYRIPTVELDGTYRATLQDIAVIESGSTAFQFKKTLAMTADALLADGAHNKGAGGNGYAYELKEVYESQLSNLEDHGMRHSLLFASWYSAANNTAEVNFTDRDINFHGGRDHGNVVVVHASERDAAADNMSGALSYNSEGAHYGAPTDPNANTITFDRMLGSKRSDVVQGSDTGAYLDGRGNADVLSGGAGNDTLIGGAGDDALIGNAGEDVARFTGTVADYAISALSDGRLSVNGRDGLDALQSIEWLEFADGSRVSTADFGTTTEPDSGSDPSPAVLTGTDGNDSFFVDDPAIVIAAGGGWDHVDSTVSYTLAPETESLTLLGEGSIDGTGNDARNILRGNEAANLLKGEGGNDDLWARGGADRLYGGAGNDRLFGQGGDDTLMGGGGRDELQGGTGADVFRFDKLSDSAGAARDVIADLSKAEGDRIDLSRFDVDSTAEGRQGFQFQGTQAFTGRTGELRYADGILGGDVDGDGAADLEVEVTGIATLESEDFLL